MTMKEIHDLCKEYEIKNYTINNDMSIDIDGDVFLNYMYIEELPLNFNRVKGSFYCSKCGLISLKGSPEYVGGEFMCEENKLKTLADGPLFVKGDFSCDLNQLKELNNNLQIGGAFFFEHNIIRDFYSFPKVNFDYVHLDFNPIAEILDAVFDVLDDDEDLYTFYNSIYYFNDLGVIQNNNHIILDRFNYLLLDLFHKEIKSNTNIPGYGII